VELKTGALTLEGLQLANYKITQLPNEFGYQCQGLRNPDPNVVWRKGSRRAHWKLAHG
jgi:hypothetical protein